MGAMGVMGLVVKEGKAEGKARKRRSLGNLLFRGSRAG